MGHHQIEPLKETSPHDYSTSPGAGKGVARLYHRSPHRGPNATEMLLPKGQGTPCSRCSGRGVAQNQGVTPSALGCVSQGTVGRLCGPPYRMRDEVELNLTLREPGEHSGRYPRAGAVRDSIRPRRDRFDGVAQPRPRRGNTLSGPSIRKPVDLDRERL